MPGIKDFIYAKLPVFGQHAAVSAYGYFWKRRRFGGDFLNALQHFQNRESNSRQQWEDYQTHELRKLLKHAQLTVPYYERLFNEIGINRERLANFELSDLPQIPVLEKQMLRKLGTTDLVSRQKSKGSSFFTSSGSTGTPVKILFSHRTDQTWSAAYEARVRNWAGVNRFNARGMIGGRRVVPDAMAKAPYYRYNYFEKQVYFSIYHLSKKNVWNYYEAIQKYKIDYLVGYSASLHLFASYVLELNLPPIQLKAVLGSSEKLTPAMKLTIQRAFLCKAFDGWSGIESCGLISENADGNMYASPDTGILEFLGTSEGRGSTREVVCTGLLNFDQPLIRYRIGDLVTVSDKINTSGIQMPIINEIVGRTDDVILLKDGRQLSSFNRFFADLQNIVEVQVIQNDFDEFVLNLVPDSGYNKDIEAQLLTSIRQRIGDVKVVINLIDKIERAKNGKFKAVISNVKRLS